MAFIGRIFRRLFEVPGIYRLELTPEAYPQVEGLEAKELYASQANLYAVVSFMAASVAQLPLKVFVRKGENERVRDRTSRAAMLLWKPNADQTSYELMNALMIELLLHGTAILWNLPDPDSSSERQLRIIPQEWIINSKADTSYSLSSITVKGRGQAPSVKIPSSEFIQFKLYAPGNPAGYQSPISALKQTLGEQIQADRFRTKIWKSSGRFNAYITRPKDVAPWDDETKKRWVEAFREGWGAGGGNAGKMPLLEDGMEIKPYQFNAEQAQYAETKQLSREDVAAAYHINPSLIWHTATQTYASARDNARALYADCLGPILQMLQQRFNSFLLPMVGADVGTYVVFDLSEKLKGSFEERASILQSAVGAPYMTRNEARADLDLPPVDGGDDLIVPLNVNDGISNPAVEDPAKGEIRYIRPRVKSKSGEKLSGKATDSEKKAVADTVSKFIKRQASSVLPKIGAGKDWWKEDRWNEELADDLTPVIEDIATSHGKSLAKKIGSDYDEDRTVDYLRALAEGRAKAINAATKRDLEEALELEDEEREEALEAVIEKRETSGADKLGISIATTAACWALGEADRQAKDQGADVTVYKTWVTGDNPRTEHANMAGETVKIDEHFSNGADWPGDDILGPEGTCYCNCSTEITIERR